MEIYVRVDKNGYINDWLDYEFEGYEKVTYDIGPIGIINNGWFKVVDGLVIEDKEVKQSILNTNGFNSALSDELSKLTNDVTSNINEISERLQHGMSNTKVIKSDVEQLEEQLAMETMSGVEKEMKIQKLEEENEFMQEQLAMEAMESLQKSQKISELKKENEEIQEQVAMETMNGLELEMRVSEIENKIEKDDK